MPTARFARYVLRTTDVQAAQAFYTAVLGHHGDHIWPLHEQALARGARPHWLGHIDVADPASSAAPLLAAGAQQLGERPDGVVVLRDVDAGLLALGGVSGPSKADVVWHVLRARDVESRMAHYAQLFGWSLGERFTLPGGESYGTFSWQADEPSAGAFAELSAGVHPQWLFFFRVASVHAAVAKVRELGGFSLEPLQLPDGRWLVACDDAQGGAFGLMEK